jgi:hypothetical protein
MRGAGKNQSLEPLTPVPQLVGQGRCPPETWNDQRSKAFPEDNRSPVVVIIYNLGQTRVRE